MEIYIDVVKNPAHYKHFTGVECKEIVYDLPKWAGDTIKYIWRAPHKGKPVEDLRKAKECLSAFTVNRQTELTLAIKRNPAILDKAHEIILAEKGHHLLRDALAVLVSLAYLLRDKEVQQLSEAIDDEIEHYLSFEDNI